MNSRCDIVVGLQFGDEGKGKLVDARSAHTDISMRYNGGVNAGHTIKLDGKKYVFHLFHSGILHPQTIGIIGNGTVINFNALLQERADLMAQGLSDPIERTLFSEKAHITFTIHCYMDKLTGAGIGTTLQGIGPTYSTKAERIGIRMGDLLESDWKTRIEEFYNRYVKQFSEHTPNITIRDHHNQEHTLNSFGDMLMYDIALLNEIYDILRPRIIDTMDYIEEHFNKRFLIEGANASLLDIDHGTYPYVTSSSPCSGGVLTGLGLSMKVLQSWNAKVIGVAKWYVTRVGGGVLPTEMKDDDENIGIQVQTIGAEFGATTGRRRRCGWLDLVALKYACRLNGCDYLNLAKADVLSDVPNLKTIKVCIQYRDTMTGRITDKFPSDECKLARMEPIYAEFPLWNTDTCRLNTCKSWKDLPLEFRTLVKFIEGYVGGIPVKYINTGQDRSDMIVRDDV